MKAIMSYIRQKSSAVLNVIIKHESSFYTFIFTSIIFLCVIFYQNANHNLEILKHKKNIAFVEQHAKDYSSVISAQKQIITNQEGALKRAAEIINQQNSFIQKAVERLKYFEGLFADPENWT